MTPNDNHQNSLTNMASSTTMDHHQKPSQDHQNHHQQALKCPRCDSSNTKFCYYNNYSLSQPRHFCKACKRYWTRGGTLRNVPVGGGCRKNKRLKRPSSAASSLPAINSPNLAAANSTTDSIQPPPPVQPQPNIQSLLSSGQSHIASLFYNHNVSPFSRYDHLVQSHSLSSLGLGQNNNNNNNNGDTTSDQNGFINNIFTSNPLLSTTYSSVFGAPPTIASLLASKFSNGVGSGTRGPSLSSFQALPPFEELNMENNKQVKLELEGQGIRSSALDWMMINNGTDHNNQTDQVGLSSDPSLYWANPSAVIGSGGANWHDPSVPSLI